MDHLKFYLYNTAFVQIALITSAYLTQHRVVPNVGSTAIMSKAACSWIGPNSCFMVYIVYTALSVDVAISISNTILYRYLVVGLHYITPKLIFIMIACSHILPFLLLLAPLADTWDFEKVRRATHQAHPTYNLTIYEPIYGFANTNSLLFMLGTAIMAGGSYGIPLCSGILTRKHLFLAMASLPGLIDPLISFYFIVPYRQTISAIFCPEKRTANKEIMTITSSSVLS
ncbi:unnamed protein product [Caenorhabditis bovis]|uniref:G-protein coupled receptors family 1 profile domain-containing protein n=1 Tax=Caenorhabditis bovis TaxID=2654633 RepID=A0A8S1EJ00_9PELO|nr:unnamed protein product [Caenorhabditis bovis]